MKLNDIVFVLKDNTIIKTRVIGKKTVVNGPDPSNEYILVVTEHKYNGSNEDWIKTSDIYKTLEEAQVEIKDRITQDILKALDRITIIDVTGGSNG